MSGPLLPNAAVARFSELFYRDPKKNKNGGMNVFINFVKGTLQGLPLQFGEADDPNTWCTAPFGISEPMGADSKDPTATISKDRKTLDLNVSDDVIQAMRQLEQHHKDEAVAKAKEWFPKKNLSPETIVSNWKSSIMEGDQYPARVRTKVNTTGDSAVKVWLYQAPTNPGQKFTCVEGSTADVTKYSKCVVIVEVTGIYFMPREFGQIITATDILVFPQQQREACGFNWGSLNKPDVVLRSFGSSGTLSSSSSSAVVGYNQTYPRHDSPLPSSAVDADYQAALDAGAGAGQTRGIELDD
jgi:hypothetical protein